MLCEICQQSTDTVESLGEHFRPLACPKCVKEKRDKEDEAWGQLWFGITMFFYALLLACAMGIAFFGLLCS